MDTVNKNKTHHVHIERDSTANHTMAAVLKKESGIKQILTSSSWNQFERMKRKITESTEKINSSLLFSIVTVVMAKFSLSIPYRFFLLFPGSRFIYAPQLHVSSRLHRWFISFSLSHSLFFSFHSSSTSLLLFSDPYR